MKILIIARGYPSKKEPQDGCFELDQAKALRELGHDVTMMSVDCRLKWEWRKIGVMRGQINDIVTYKIFLFPTSIIRRLSYRLSSWIDKKLALRLFRKIQQECGRFDVLHAHFLPCIFLGVYIKEHSGIPLVGTEHWSELNVDTLKPYVSYLGNKAYPYVDCLISVCKSLQSRIYKHFDIDSHVIHNMIADDFTLETTGIESHPKFRFIAVGSLIHTKGFDILVDSFALSHLIEKNAELIIVGDGPEHTNLQKHIDKLGLQQNITLAGRKSKPEIVELLKSSDVYISSSRSENFSVAILEALSMGLPVIATICGGIKECIDGCNGLLVPIENAEELAVAMKNMYDNYTNYDRDIIRQDCLDKYSPKVIAKQIESVYSKVFNQDV